MATTQHSISAGSLGAKKDPQGQMPPGFSSDQGQRLVFSGALCSSLFLGVDEVFLVLERLGLPTAQLSLWSEAGASLHLSGEEGERE